MTRLAQSTTSSSAGRSCLTVGAGDLKVSKDPRDVLVTTSLGSSIGLTLYDWVERVGGLIHCTLPLAKVDPERAQRNPATFVDTGVAVLLAEMLAAGARRKNLVAKAVGAASLMGDESTFRTGERNLTVLRKILWQNDLRVARAEVGGAQMRALSFYLEDGRVTVRSAGAEVTL